MKACGTSRFHLRAGDMEDACQMIGIFGTVSSSELINSPGI